MKPYGGHNAFKSDSFYLDFECFYPLPKYMIEYNLKKNLVFEFLL